MLLDFKAEKKMIHEIQLLHNILKLNYKYTYINYYNRWKLFNSKYSGQRIIL